MKMMSKLGPPLRQLRRAFSSSTAFTSSSSSSSSSPAFFSPRVERISVPARSNGSFTIDATPITLRRDDQTTQPSSANRHPWCIRTVNLSPSLACIFHPTKPAAPVILYLPSGPVIPDYHDEELRILTTLARASEAAIVRVNYRASSAHPYPTPIHDTTLAYDWIKENLVQHAPTASTMGVCGELVGASLAVTLGLTECHHHRHHRIAAVSVNNPIVDWVFPHDLPVVPVSELPEPLAPEETAFPVEEDPMSIASEAHLAKPSKRAAKSPPKTTWQLHADNPTIPTVTLLAERDVLFRKPEHYFDRFASPIHMFRSPHGTLVYPNQNDDSFASQEPQAPIDLQTQMDISHYEALDATPPPPLEPPMLIRCRAYARFYPPAGVHLDLPAWHVAAGMESPLLDQASELSKLLRRSVARAALKSTTGRARWFDDTEKARYKALANDRVQLDTLSGIGLWTEQGPGSTWESNVTDVGLWMKEQLMPKF
ncbi:unnamed protein product [Periconia digitata]|uniref:Alpha/beta hydrolase fold-3 domain-containing protein n=1 Tax=Periconia digitata TaxID=1303443 RepID=A0A9W4U9T7_9PLEO|nr:unnamed protein product [Periconia digitata]